MVFLITTPVLGRLYNQLPTMVTSRTGLRHFQIDDLLKTPTADGGCMNP